MRKAIILAALCIGVMAAAGPARADLLYVTENEMGPYGTNSYSGGTLGWSSYFSGYNGQMILTANAGSGPGQPIFHLPIWCIDQPGYIGLGQNPSVNGTPIIYAIEPLTSFTSDFSGNLISFTQARQMAALANLGDATIARLQQEDPRDPAIGVFSNAVQAAITNIEYGSTSDGGPAVNARTIELMDWARSLTPVQLATYNAVILVDAEDQKLIVAVPEPGTLLLLAAALVALAVEGRWRGGRLAHRRAA